MIVSDRDTISEIQKLAKIGYWTYDFVSKKFQYSKELMDLCISETYIDGLELEDFFNLVDEDDIEKVKRIIRENKGLKTLNYEFEFKIKSSTCQDKYAKVVVSKRLDETRKRIVIIQGILQDITELKKSQIELKKNKERLDFAIDTVGMGIWEWDIKNDISIVSPNIYKIADLPSDYNISQKSWSSRIHENDRDRVRRSVFSCVSGDSTTYDCDYRFVKPNGDIIWVNSVGAAVNRATDNTAVRMIGILFDITERKLAVENLKISEGRLMDAQRLTKLGNWEVDLNSNTVYWSEEIYRIHGYKPGEVQPTSELFLSHIHPDDLQYVKSEISTLSETGSYIIVTRINTHDGKLKYIEELAYSVKDKEGNIIKIVGTTQDITESKLAEQKIRESEMILKETQKAAKIGSWQLDVESNRIDASEEFYRLFGYSCKTTDLPFDFIYSHVFDTDREKLEAYHDSLSDGKRHTVSYRILSNNGIVRNIKDTAISKLDINNKVVSYQGYIQDITEIKQKEQDVLDSRGRLRLAADLANLGYWEYFVDSQKLVVHELYTDALNADLFKGGSSINDFLNKLDNKEKQKVMTAIRTMIKNGKDCEIKVKISINCEDVWLQLKGSCYYANNNLIKLYGYVQDVTERHKSQEALIIAKEKAEESDRLKSAFLANISHEVRTPLNSVMGFSKLIIDNGYSTEEKNEFANAIYRNSGSLFKLINDVLDLSLLETDEIVIKNADVEVNSIINNLYDNIEISSDSNVRVKMHRLDENLSINTDARRLHQILYNFISNAIKYTDKGTVEIGAKRISNGNLSLYVKDTGIGIPKDFLHKIFDRFQQRNKFKEGVGLGLSISKGFADLLDLELKVESQENVGSEFFIEIPAKRLSIL